MVSMKVLDKVRLVVYRVHEKGLEIFLVNSEKDQKKELFTLSGGEDTAAFLESINKTGLKTIALDPVADHRGGKVSAFAVEGDWHDIPSIRALLKEDVNIVKSKIKEMVADEHGAYVLVKDAFKKVLPYEYSILKELKEILTEKNVVQNI